MVAHTFDMLEASATDRALEATQALLIWLVYMAFRFFRVVVVAARNVEGGRSTSFVMSFAPFLAPSDECCVGSFQGAGIDLLFIEATESKVRFWNDGITQ